MAPITSLYGGALAVLFLVLSARVIMYRRRNKISLGDGGDKGLLKRMRAQANCAEYAPFGVLLLLLCELQSTPPIALHLLGLTLLIGRLLHGYGFSARPPSMNLRVLGMTLTLLMLSLASLGLLAHALI